MPTADIERRLYGRRYMTIGPVGLQPVGTGIAVLTNLPATAGEIAAIPVHDNCLLESVGVAWVSSTGTTSSMTVAVRRATTSLASVTATGTGRTAGVSSDVDAVLTKGEALNVTITAGTADDDFVGVMITLCFAPMKSNS